RVFFFQAEDGIRDFHVTGVQTCALPILATLAAGTKLYDVYATSMAIKTSIIPSISRNYAQQRRNSAVKIGELELTSPLIASAFGDSGVFFKHQRHEDQ